MAHDCIDCERVVCDCLAGEIDERNCIGCGCDFADDEDEDEADD